MDSVRCRTAERFPTRKRSFRFPGILLYLIVLYHPFAVPVHACIVPLTRTDVKNRFHSGRTSCKGGLLHKIMYSGPYFYKIPLQMN